MWKNEHMHLVKNETLLLESKNNHWNKNHSGQSKLHIRHKGRENCWTGIYI